MGNAMSRPSHGRQANGRSSIYLGSDGRWHGRVTVGIRDDGSPDRPHDSASTEGVVTGKVRDLEQKRSALSVPKVGERWTVES
jgi:integrase